MHHTEVYFDNKENKSTEVHSQLNVIIFTQVFGFSLKLSYENPVFQQKTQFFNKLLP